MYQVTDKSLERLIHASQTLNGKLIASPIWELIKDEPVIVEWTAAILDVRAQMGNREVYPENQSQR